MANKTKVCSKCGKRKQATSKFFYKNNAKKDKLDIRCKICRKEFRHESYLRNKEAENVRAMKYYDKNKKKISKRMKDYYQKNQPKLSKKAREYYHKVKEKTDD
jgi:hypothetical protein